ncbi:MAG: hypothetical protein AAFX07_17735, partial [Pseudomonadota bacterium]
TRAGDVILDEPFPAEPTGGFALAYLDGVPASSTKSWVSTEHDDHDDHDQDMMMIPSTAEDEDASETLALLSVAANDDFGIEDDPMGDDFSEFYAGPLEDDQPAVEDTSSEPTALTSGSGLWHALTAGHPILGDQVMAEEDDEPEEMLLSA